VLLFECKSGPGVSALVFLKSCLGFAAATSGDFGARAFNTGVPNPNSLVCTGVLLRFLSEAFWFQVEKDFFPSAANFLSYGFCPCKKERRRWLLSAFSDSEKDSRWLEVRGTTVVVSIRVLANGYKPNETTHSNDCVIGRK
jgi:hypothetical protein